jgi:hypothetical protein
VFAAFGVNERDAVFHAGLDDLAMELAPLFHSTGVIDHRHTDENIRAQ